MLCRACRRLKRKKFNMQESKVSKCCEFLDRTVQVIDLAAPGRLHVYVETTHSTLERLAIATSCCSVEGLPTTCRNRYVARPSCVTAFDWYQRKQSSSQKTSIYSRKATLKLIRHGGLNKFRHYTDSYRALTYCNSWKQQSVRRKPSTWRDI